MPDIDPEPDERPAITAHCPRCGGAVLLSTDQLMRLCPQCTSRSLGWLTFVLYTACVLAALLLIGMLLHFWFPRQAPRPVPDRPAVQGAS